jgi:hypothetical protein
MEALVHEMKHVRQNRIDEREAYEVNCELRAKQECWRFTESPKKVREMIKQCVDQGVAGSTSAGGRDEIERGCLALCKKAAGDPERK